MGTTQTFQRYTDKIREAMSREVACHHHHIITSYPYRGIDVLVPFLHEMSNRC
jgi:hypothetical protein